MSRTYKKQYKNTRKPSLKPYNRAKDLYKLWDNCEQPESLRRHA